MPPESPSSRKVVVTGLGILAPTPYLEALEGRRAHPPSPAPELTGFEAAEGAPAYGFELADFKIEDHLPNVKTFVDRTSALALAAAKRALADAGLLDPAARPQGVEIGCAYGSTMGCLEAMGIFWKKCKSGNPKFAPPLAFTHGYANSPSSLLCIEFGLRGAAATFSGERLAGVEAILFAYDQIASGSAEIVLTGASESLTRAVHAHLFSEGRLSSSGRANIWNEDNDGVVPGEGGAFLVLESADSAAARGRTAYAELAAVTIGSGSAVNPYLEAWDRAGEDALRDVTVASGPVLVIAATPEEPSVDSWERPFWARRLAKAPSAAAIAPKLFTGELMSVSPVLSACLAAEILGEKRNGTGLPGAVALAEGQSAPATGPFSLVFAGAIDPLAAAGLVVLRKA